jgi:hypothetical protein
MERGRCECQGGYFCGFWGARFIEEEEEEEEEEKDAPHQSCRESPHSSLAVAALDYVSLLFRSKPATTAHRRGTRDTTRGVGPEPDACTVSQ